MKKNALGLAGLLLLLGVAGCGDQDRYNDSLEYGLRTDPIYAKQDLKEEPYYPDRPGQFPLLAAKDLKDPRNPLYAENKEKDLFKSGVFRDPTLVPADAKKIFLTKLKELFGSPRVPLVADLEEAAKSVLKIDAGTLSYGSQLYRVHCLHCHGVTGNGRGPTARWINPHPRDFRPMLFKFQSVDQIADELPPSRDDLLRTLRHGIEGTAMPSFAVLPERELEALASYVIHLSIRGKVELEMIRSVFDYNKDANKLTVADDFLDENKAPSEEKIGEQIASYAKSRVGKWVKAQSTPIKVAEYPYKPEQLKESVLRGQDLFNGKASKDIICYTCHINYGQEAKYRYDGWATLVRPANLTQGVFRGGRRPVDMYYRIHSGINGSGMAKFGNIVKSPNEIWDLVNFVQVAGNPRMREALGIKLDRPPEVKTPDPAVKAAE